MKKKPILPSSEDEGENPEIVEKRPKAKSLRPPHKEPSRRLTKIPVKPSGDDIPLRWVKADQKEDVEDDDEEEEIKRQLKRLDEERRVLKKKLASTRISSPRRRPYEIEDEMEELRGGNVK